MSRLVNRIRSEDRPGAMPNGTFIGGTTLDPLPGVPSGVIIDGAYHALEGQPPTAVSKGWGDMSWLLYPTIDY